MQVELNPAKWSRSVRLRVLLALTLMVAVAAVASFLAGAIPLGAVWSAAVVVATLGGVYSFGRDIAKSAKSRLEQPIFTEVGRTPHLGLEFWQDHELVPMTVEKPTSGKIVVVAHLRKRAFQMRIPHYTPNMQVYVCAWSDDSIFELDEKETTREVEFLSGGTGIADYQFASGTLFVRRDGHGHFAGSRMAQISDNKAEIFFATAWIGDSAEPVPLARLDSGDIFLTVYIDRGVEEGLAAVDNPRDYYTQAHPLRTGPGLPWYDYVILRFR